MEYVLIIFDTIIKLQKYILNMKNGYAIHEYTVFQNLCLQWKFPSYLLTPPPPKKMSSMQFSRFGRKSETVNYLGLIICICLRNL